MRKLFISFLIIHLISLLHGYSAERKAGDILQIALPITAISSICYMNDLDGFKSFIIVLPRVDLPEPDWPMMDRNSPDSIFKSSLFRAWTGPAPVQYALETSRSSINEGHPFVQVYS